jgi:hypothetical protein
MQQLTQKNSYEAYGNRERLFLSGFCSVYGWKIIEESLADGYDGWEAVTMNIQSATTYVVEVKIRDKKFSEYGGKTVLIEKNKVWKIIQKIDEISATTGVYISVYRDCICCVQVPEDLLYEWKKSWQPTSKMNPKLIEKEVEFTKYFHKITNKSLLKIYDYPIESFITV